MMYKLCENNTVVDVDCTIRCTSFDDKYTYSRINSRMLFNNKYEWILFDINYASGLMIPINLEIMGLIKDVHSIEFKFEKCLKDTPPDDETIVPIQAEDYTSVIKALINYNNYMLINYLPYTDFAIDHMPMLTQVYINGKPSDLFDQINSYINDNFKDVMQIRINTSGGYSLHYDYDFKKSKKISANYIKVNETSVLYYSTSRYENKLIKYLDRVEVTLRWFDKANEDYLTSYTESVQDDYFSCSSGISEVLTLCATYEYLVNYYFNELKDMTKNHFLIIAFTVYFRLKTGLHGIQMITTDNDNYWNKNMLPVICSKLYSIVRD